MSRIEDVVQFAPAATLEPHVFVSAKLALAVMLVMLSVAPPVLVKVTVCGLLVVPNSCVPKVSLVGVSVAAGLVCSRMETPSAP